MNLRDNLRSSVTGSLLVAGMVFGTILPALAVEPATQPALQDTIGKLIRELGDDNYKIGLTKQIFRRCSICGLKHSRKVRTCEHCPRDRPEPRKSWPRGGLLRDNRNRRRLGRKLD